MAARFENLIACHLLKYCHFLTDTGQGEFDIRYLRYRNHKEIDFLILRDGKPWIPIEVKLRSDKPSSSWKYFLPHLPCKKAVQITMKPNVHKLFYIDDTQVLIVSAEKILSFLV